MTATTSTRTWPLTDLVLRAAAGDELAFARIVHQLDGLVTSVSRRFFAPGLDRDDLMQEARIALHSAVRSWNGRGSFTGFAVLVLERRLGTAVKAAKRAKHQTLNESLSLATPAGAVTLADALAAPGTDPADIAEARETLRHLAEPGWLTPLEANVLAISVGHSGHGCYGEAMERLGVNHKSVDNALQRARRKAALRLAA